MIEVAATAPSLCVATAATLVSQEILRAQNLLRIFVANVRILFLVVMREVVVLVFMLAELHHNTVLRPSLLSL